MGGSEHPGILYFYSESIGFGVNGVCAFIAALTNLGVGERDISTAILFIIIGGVMQLLCKFYVFTLQMFLQYIVLIRQCIAHPYDIKSRVPRHVLVVIHMSLQHISYAHIFLSPKLHTDQY